MSRFGSIGLGAATVAAGLGLYMASYSVAEERDRIEDLSLQIAADKAAIERLEAELGVRASLARLERINAQVWSLKAPSPQQIVGGSAHLTSFMRPEGEVVLHQASLMEAPQAAPVETAAVEPVPSPDPVVRAALSEAEPERAVPVQAAPMTIAEAEAPRGGAGAAALRAAPDAAAEEAPDIFSDDFQAEVAAAATLERAGFHKIALR